MHGLDRKKIWGAEPLAVYSGSLFKRIKQYFCTHYFIDSMKHIIPSWYAGEREWVYDSTCPKCEFELRERYLGFVTKEDEKE